MHLSDAEWEVMDALWRLRAATAREIRDALPPANRWAYTTVKTMLDRLARKGAVSEAKEGRRLLFTPLLTRAAARRAALGTLLDRAFDGSWAPLLSFAAEDRRLPKRERDALRRLLEEEERRKGAAPCAAADGEEAP